MFENIFLESASQKNLFYTDFFFYFENVTVKNFTHASYIKQVNVFFFSFIQFWLFFQCPFIQYIRFYASNVSIISIVVKNELLAKTNTKESVFVCFFTSFFLPFFLSFFLSFFLF